MKISQVNTIQRHNNQNSQTFGAYRINEKIIGPLGWTLNQFYSKLGLPDMCEFGVLKDQVIIFTHKDIEFGETLTTNSQKMAYYKYLFDNAPLVTEEWCVGKTQADVLELTDMSLKRFKEFAVQHNKTAANDA